MKTWCLAQDDMMREFYPNHTMKDLVQMIGKTEHAIYNRSFKLGIKKSPEYLDSPAAYRFRRDHTSQQKAHRFTKGNEPWNKGVKGLDIGGKATRFKKGSKPANYRPVGSLRPAKDGDWEIKARDGVRGWQLLHHFIWERMNGKIPKGMILVFLDGDHRNFKITNFSPYTKAQNMQRNTYHNYPKEIAQLIQLQGAITRQLNKRTKQNEYRYA